MTTINNKNIEEENKHIEYLNAQDIIEPDLIWTTEVNKNGKENNSSEKEEEEYPLTMIKNRERKTAMPSESTIDGGPSTSSRSLMEVTKYNSKNSNDEIMRFNTA